MELEEVMKEIRSLVGAYDNSDINRELNWSEDASNRLSELVLRFDMEQE